MKSAEDRNWPRTRSLEETNLLKFANETPAVLSLLYDLDLMPEQTADTPAYAKTMNVIAHCAKLRADTLRHAAEICRASGNLEDRRLFKSCHYDDAEAIEAAAGKLTEGK